MYDYEMWTIRERDKKILTANEMNFASKNRRLFKNR